MSDLRYIPRYSYVTCKAPTEADRQLDGTLTQFISDAASGMQLEEDKEMIHRGEVLLRVRTIFLNFVKEVAMEVHKMSEDDADDAGGDLLVSGSHILGVRDKNADIDTICVAPKFVTREHFFTILKDEISSRPDVTNFSKIETAAVPIMSFDFQGVSIDLLFAQLAVNKVPKDSEVLLDKKNHYVLNDKILLGIDVGTEKSLNGPRVTYMIQPLANKARDEGGRIIDHEAFPTRADGQMENKFLIVLRCVRKWAKAKGLYGNMMGYLGGINCNLLVAMVCQIFPNASPSNLLYRFFQLYSKWQYPQPIQLNEIQPHPSFFGENDKGDVWTPEEARIRREVMPIITPAYPAMNSAVNVSEDTLAVMVKELESAYKICKSITTIIQDEGYKGWGRLFEPSDFFIMYDHYLTLNIIANGDDVDSKSWIGYCESRIRTFLPFIHRDESLSGIKRPLHLFPKSSKTQKSANSLCYFVGFNADKSVNLADAASRFKAALFEKFRGGSIKDGFDFVLEPYPWKRLPKEVFAQYGGRAAAKQRRQELGFARKKEVAPAEVVPAAAPAETGATDMQVEGEAKTDEETPEAVAAESKEEPLVVEDDKANGKKRKTAGKDSARLQAFPDIVSGKKDAQVSNCWPEDILFTTKKPSLRPINVSWN